MQAMAGIDITKGYKDAKQSSNPKKKIEVKLTQLNDLQNQSSQTNRIKFCLESKLTYFLSISERLRQAINCSRTESLSSFLFHSMSLTSPAGWS
jgi:hypothetical protein